MHKFFRFGLPLGSAVIVVAILKLASTVRSAFYTLDAFLVLKSSKLELEDYITVTCSCVSLCLTALLWTQVIFKGKRCIGYFWFFTSIVNCTIEMLQTCYDLKFHSQDRSSREFYVTLWGLCVSISTNIYVYIVAAQMINSFTIQDELTSFREILKPIGMRCIGILEYYQGHPKLGSRVLLVADIMWSGYLLIAYELLHYDFSRFDWLNDLGKANIYFFSGKASTIIAAEEIFMRIFRVLNGVIGCYLILRNTNKLKPWLFTQLVGIAASIIMYIILFAMTKDWASEVCGYLYQFLFTSDIVFRYIILHFCIEFKRDLDVISVV